MPHASQFSQVFTWKKLWKIARTMSHARMLAFSFGDCRDSEQFTVSLRAAMQFYWKYSRVRERIGERP